MPLPPTDLSERLDLLTRLNVDELLASTGLAFLRRTPLRWLFWPAARRFAKLVHEFDNRVGEQGLAKGSEWLLLRMSGGLRVQGVDHLPATGPVFVLANHPGMTDTVALFVSLARRPDLRVIALDRPFLRALPHVARQLILLPEDEAGRWSVVRAGVKHLKQGGALLTFPAGEIEPDPGVFGRRAAIDSLKNWSDSHAVFGRLVPQTRIVPAIVSHVLSVRAQTNPLTRWRRTAQDREKLAAALQVMWSPYQKQVVKVAFGPQQTVPADGALAAQAAVDGARQVIETIAWDVDHGGGWSQPVLPLGEPT
ncbi:MAG: glycerol acyltransferase [Rubrivivax sp.]|nr:MAG: glycerol acyltransferase [Rubrivivax sp.]